jgi:hypothetical protein
MDIRNLGIAQQIVAGSREADRMKGDVVTVITTLTELLVENRIPPVRVEFMTGSYEWEYTISPHTPGGVLVRCYGPKETPELGKPCLLVFGGTREEMRFRYRNVRIVHQLLDAFVAGMMERFPDLESYLEPVLAMNGSGRT